MYAQLGNIIFEGLFGFDSFSKEDNTTYAKHDLISGKPRLQPTASELEQITIPVHLRADFIAVESTILSFKKSKDTFEVLPFVLGNGRYLGDYVIISLSETHNEAFADGTLLDVTLEITLQEYAVADKLQQQQQSARKNAFAVGNKTPVLKGLTQSTTIPNQATKNLSLANAETKSIDNQVINYANNTSQQNFISKDIQTSIASINAQLDSYNDKLQSMQNIFDDVDTVADAIQRVKDAANGFVFPIPNISTLQSNNLQLQSNMQQLNIISTPLNYTVISRRA